MTATHSILLASTSWVASWLCSAAVCTQIAPSSSTSPAGGASDSSNATSSPNLDSRNRVSLDSPALSGGASFTRFVLWGTPPTVHLSLEALHSQQHRARLGGGHSHIFSAFMQLLQLGLGPGKLCTHFFPCYQVSTNWPRAASAYLGRGRCPLLLLLCCGSMLVSLESPRSAESNMLHYTTVMVCPQIPMMLQSPASIPTIRFDLIRVPKPFESASDPLGRRPSSTLFMDSCMFPILLLYLILSTPPGYLSTSDPRP